MKVLLRSLFIADQADDPSQFLVNHQKFLSSGLGFNVPEYNVLWNFIREFVRTHNHSPSVATLRAHFTHAKEDEVLNEVEHLVGFKSLTKGDFEAVLNARADDRRLRLWIETLKEAAIITQTGMEVREGKDTKLLKGPIHAARYVVEKARDVVAPTLGGRLSGEVTKDGKAVLIEYETVESDPLAGLGQLTWLKQMDTALSGAKRYELWIHAAFTGGVKCLAGDARIFDVTTGQMQRVRDLQGSPSCVHALSNGALGTYLASPTVSQGIRPLFKVLTDSGRTLRVSGNHPFLTPEGYVDADKLRPDGWVAVAARMAISQGMLAHHFSDAEVKILGYLLGNGRIQDDITFTNSKKRTRADFLQSLETMGVRPGGDAYVNYREVQGRPCKSDRRRTIQVIRVSRSDDQKRSWVSPVRTLLNRTGLYGCASADKFIPGTLWGCSDQQIWLFLSALWATDGHLDREVPRDSHRGRPSVWYASISRTLAGDIQLLLQRVGIHASVSEVKTSVHGEPYPYWYVKVLRRNLWAFLTNIAPVGKEVGLRRARQAFDQDAKYDGGRIPAALLRDVPDGLRIPSRNGWVYAKWAKRRGWISGWVANRFTQHPECPAKAKEALSQDVVWERLVSVHPDGEEETFDLSVPGPENCVANGFITHNSTFMLNWAYNQAVVYKHDVLIFSLEMPYNQCRRILYAMHSMHPKFRETRVNLGLQQDVNQDIGLPYQHIRDGNLHEWNPNARRFFKDFVIPDFNGEDVVKHLYWKPDYGKIHIEVADPDKNEFTVLDLRSMAEVLYARSPFAMIFVDHCGLMSPRRFQRGTTENINEVIRDLKKLALGFNRGQGMAVVGLFQISREGYKSALKTKEKTGKAGYNLTHLSYANEAERCVAISTTYARTPIGFRPILEASQQAQTVWSGSGWKRIQQVFHNGVRRIWEVTTDRGSKLHIIGSVWCRMDSWVGRPWRCCAPTGTIWWAPSGKMTPGPLISQNCPKWRSPSTRP